MLMLHQTLICSLSAQSPPPSGNWCIWLVVKLMALYILLHTLLKNLHLFLFVAVAISATMQFPSIAHDRTPSDMENDKDSLQKVVEGIFNMYLHIHTHGDNFL